jgi:hypothetical protein
MRMHPHRIDRDHDILDPVFITLHQNKEKKSVQESIKRVCIETEALREHSILSLSPPQTIGSFNTFST